MQTIRARDFLRKFPIALRDGMLLRLSNRDIDNFARAEGYFLRSIADIERERQTALGRIRF